MSTAEYPPAYLNANNAGRIVGVVGVFCFLAITFVSLRIYVRVFMVRAFGVDDALIILACALALMSWICLVLQIPYGLGRHAVVIPVENRIKFERITFWKTVFSDGFALGLLRISMAISLLRLKKDLRWYRWSLFAVMVFVVLYSIQAITWLFVYCTPYSGWWEFQWMNPFDPRCKSFTVFVDLVYWNVSCNIFTDVLLGALPVPIIWNLKMKLRVRLYVIGILNLGYLAVLMGILKAVFMLTTGGDPDAIFNYWVHFWENLQLDIGIIAACASFLKPLVGRLLKINSSAGYSHPTSGRYYHRGGRTPMGGETIGSKYANRRQADRSHADEFELHTKTEHEVVTRVQAAGSPAGSQERVSAEAVDVLPSDTNSEEIILQKPGAAHGIVISRDVKVQYSSK
ncbi:e0629435-eb59-45cf-9678-2ab46b64b916 [Thermothielavioides terrestris]|uniref:Rhodopsin domain-containing protein n=2 Tax=Thermothielavioides terrestris TaxID=2587410 RepID=G2R917_THETT|nr:uncharacterized protein THITE_2079469 [Thermothielavioides terrestris NRRL 8126]AEO68612.1 hypothetical protein THITE_2079469 [Thermothielavioides terrestris NRRL 8126]SPQ23120.1 e0629435-eb59-45cf-9678-2ab46b64b916 [Thermothielavioides terrestris]